MKKFQISQKRFLEWLINDKDDHLYWGNRFIEELKADNHITVTTKELFEERSELPLYLFEKDFSDEDFAILESDYADDVDISEIELVEGDWKGELEKCKKSFAYFFENYWTINGHKPNEILIQRVKNKYPDAT